MGASGAISGVLGFYYLWFPKNRVNVFVFLFPFLMDVFAVPARFVLGVFVLLDNLLPFLLRSSEGGGVAHGAHLGGFVAGLGGAWLLGTRSDASGASGFAQADAGRPGTSVRGVSGSPGAALGPGELVTRGFQLLEQRRADAALSAFRSVLRDVPSGPERARAALGAGLVRWRLQGQLAPAYQYLLDALSADPPPDVAATARATLVEMSQASSHERLGDA